MYDDIGDAAFPTTQHSVHTLYNYTGFHHFLISHNRGLSRALCMRFLLNKAAFCASFQPFCRERMPVSWASWPIISGSYCKRSLWEYAV